MCDFIHVAQVDQCGLKGDLEELSSADTQEDAKKLGHRQRRSSIVALARQVRRASFNGDNPVHEPLQVQLQKILGRAIVTPARCLDGPTREASMVHASLFDFSIPSNILMMVYFPDKFEKLEKLEKELKNDLQGGGTGLAGKVINICKESRCSKDDWYFVREVVNILSKSGQRMKNALFVRGVCLLHGVCDQVVDYGEALDMFEQAAFSDHRSAHYALGYMNCIQKGASRIDLEEAEGYFNQTPLHPCSQFILGSLAQLGLGSYAPTVNLDERSVLDAGIPKDVFDFDKAIALYTRGAELGHAESQYLLGILYVNQAKADHQSTQVSTLLDKALSHFQQASDQSHREASYALAACYSEFQHHPLMPVSRRQEFLLKDQAESHLLLGRAAKGGMPLAIFHLARLSYTNGTNPDDKEGCMRLLELALPTFPAAQFFITRLFPLSSGHRASGQLTAHLTPRRDSLRVQSDNRTSRKESGNLRALTPRRGSSRAASGNNTIPNTPDDEKQMARPKLDKPEEEERGRELAQFFAMSERDRELRWSEVRDSYLEKEYGYDRGRSISPLPLPSPSSSSSSSSSSRVRWRQRWCWRRRRRRCRCSCAWSRGTPARGLARRWSGAR